MVQEGRGTQQAMVVILIILMLMLVPQTIAASVDDWQKTPLPVLVEHSLIRLIILAIPLLLTRMLLVQGRHWNQINYRRQMAAAWGFAAHVPLAQPHPLPNVGALPVPFTIKLKARWPQVPLILLLIAVSAIFLLIIAASLIITGDFLESLQLATHGLPLIFWMMWSICIVPHLMRWLLPRQIEITSEGLIVGPALSIWPGHSWRPKNWQSTITWREARLFAIRGGEPGEANLSYELASPYKIVKWKRICSPRWWSLYRPAIPFAEYDAQMDALIALISGVTGLPLYDVR